MTTDQCSAPHREAVRWGSLAPLLLAGWLAGGCAGSGQAFDAAGAPEQASQPTTPVRQDIVQRLAAQCYWLHEGERRAYGGAPVYVACRDWAERRTRGLGQKLMVY